MKKVVKTGLMLLSFVAIVVASGSSLQADNGANVLVNHVCANGTRTIELAIDACALEGHLGHGDSVVDTGNGSGW